MPFIHPDFEGVRQSVRSEMAPCESIVHPDDAAVDALAALMKAKLSKQRAKGYGGWDTDCTQQRLSDLLRGHVDKGDPVDVANFCAFLLARGEGIAAAPQAVQPAVPATNHSETPNSSTIIVPYGWKLVPDDATPEWVTNLEALPDWREAVGECIKRFLAAAPAHPAEGVPAQAGPVGYVALAALTSRTHADDYAKCFATEAALLENYPAAKAIAVFDHAATQPAAQGLDAKESDYQRGYRHGYNRRDAEVKGALL